MDHIIHILTTNLPKYVSEPLTTSSGFISRFHTSMFRYITINKDLKQTQMKQSGSNPVEKQHSQLFHYAQEQFGIHQTKKLKP